LLSQYIDYCYPSHLNVEHSHHHNGVVTTVAPGTFFYTLQA
jgi:hypothetical protein